jgi:hypothetical protein
VREEEELIRKKEKEKKKRERDRVIRNGRGGKEKTALIKKKVRAIISTFSVSKYLSLLTSSYNYNHSSYSKNYINTM